MNSYNSCSVFIASFLFLSVCDPCVRADFVELDSKSSNSDAISISLDVNGTFEVISSRLKCRNNELSPQLKECLANSFYCEFVTFPGKEDKPDAYFVGLLRHVLAFRSACREPSQFASQFCQHGDDNSLKDSFSNEKLAPRNSQGESNYLENYLIDLLRRIGDVYQHSTNITKCVRPNDIISKLESSPATNNVDVFKAVAKIIGRHILQGDHLSLNHDKELANEFVHYLFRLYGNTGDTVDRNSLEKLLVDLRIRTLHDQNHNHTDHHVHDHDGHDHDHEHEDEHDHNHDHEHDHEHEHGHNHDHDHGHDHGHNHDHEHHHEHSKAVGNYHRTKRNIPLTIPPHLDMITLKDAMHAEDTHHQLTTKCWSTGDFFEQFALESNNTITREEFMNLCPVIIHQVVSGVCRQNSSNLEKVNDAEHPKSWEVYIYGSISVLLISLCAVAGVLLQPFIHSNVYKYLMMGFIGLAFGSLAGDALLHLIPEALGLHTHSHESHGDHDHVHDHVHHDHDHHSHHHSHDSFTFSNVPHYLWLQLGSLAAIYGLFMFESAMDILSGDKQGSDNRHGHSHFPEQRRSGSNQSLEQGLNGRKTESNIQLTSANFNGSVITIDEKPRDKSKVILKSQPVFLGLTSLALMVTIGDAVHNFGDGVAIGVAFSNNLVGGLSTSLAVFCHELPHEFGDFVVLLSTGLTIKQAAMLNFLSALSAFAGLYIGIPLGENELARQWILAICAGLFLYVALTDMLPELKEYRGSRPWRMFLVKNVGALTGIVILLLIALFEDFIQL